MDSHSGKIVSSGPFKSSDFVQTGSSRLYLDSKPVKCGGSESRDFEELREVRFFTPSYISGKTAEELYVEFWSQKERKDGLKTEPNASKGSEQKCISKPLETFGLELGMFMGLERPRNSRDVQPRGPEGLEEAGFIDGMNAQESFIEFMNRRAEMRLTNKSSSMSIDQPTPKPEKKEPPLSTPLQNAVLDRNLESMTELLKGGANPDDIDLCDTTALHYAAMNGYLEEVRCLLDYGASLKVYDFNGESPLHLAAEYDHFEVAEELVKRGADVTEKNNDGKRPFDLAKKSKTPEMRTLLCYDGSMDIKQPEEKEED